MSRPTVSLVIPAYNEEKYIESCLQYAIEHAGDRLLEIIVVNNASTDGTHDKLAAFPNVREVCEEKKGLTCARQRGYTEAKGDIVAYIDADTHMPAKWVATIIDTFSKEPNVVCLSGPYTYFDVSPLFRLGVWLYWRVLAIPMYWMIGYMTVGGNFAIRRETLDKMSGFDMTIAFYGEDTDIARRATQFGKVKFTMKLMMPTSGRRFRGQGILKTIMAYSSNFLSIVFTHRPTTQEYQDLR